MSSTYTPIASATLNSAASSVTIGGIPQTYTDLVVVSDCSVGSGTLYFAYQVGNGSVDTASNYSYTYVLGSGSAASSGRVSNDTRIEPFTNTGSNNRLNVITSFQDYANTTTYKTALTRHNSPSDTRAVAASVALWRSTSAIDTLKIFSIDGNNFNSGSTFNLYGIASASITNVAKATGGDSVTTDGTYWYHTFYSSGTFTPTQAITADYLVVAGGGGGSFGGGGAGGLRSTVTATGGGGSLESSLSLSINTNYTITVGGGGTGGIHTTTSASNGVDSSIAGTGISTITSTGGGYGGGQTNNTGAGNSGGSGGGGGHGTGTSGNVVSPTNGGTETANQGYAGGAGRENPNYGGGGGGGAGAQGGTPSTTVGGSGGTGVASSITGSSVTYAGGGGGAYSGTGGTGGGGTGGTAISGQGVAGTVNTGGGGGGANRANPSEPGAGNGGSGIVIIRYAV